MESSRPIELATNLQQKLTEGEFSLVGVVASLLLFFSGPIWLMAQLGVDFGEKKTLSDDQKFDQFLSSFSLLHAVEEFLQDLSSALTSTKLSLACMYPLCACKLMMELCLPGVITK